MESKSRLLGFTLEGKLGRHMWPPQMLDSGIIFPDQMGVKMFEKGVFGRVAWVWTSFMH